MTTSIAGGKGDADRRASIAVRGALAVLASVERGSERAALRARTLADVTTGADLVGPLCRLLGEDLDAEVRAAAAFALDRLRDGGARPALLRALEDPDWTVRSNAGWGLVHLGPSVRDDVERVAASTSSFDAREMARLVLLRI